MQTNLIIIDNFYNNVDEVRNFALAQSFDITGNFPGSRTRTFINQGIKDSISNIIKPHAGEVTNWFERDGLTGSFQLATAIDRTWIHSDHYNEWAGVCYLTPDAPLSSGTGLFKHKETSKRYILPGEDNSKFQYYDYTKWEMVDKIGNIYNRLILYRGKFFHASLDYFGDDLQNGRLFQVFFFDTQF